MSDARLTPRPARRPLRRRGRAARVVLALVLIVVLAAAAVGTAVWYRYFRAENDVVAGTPVEVAIDRGSGTAEIARTLVDAGVIANSQMFRWQAKQAGADGTLKAGEYRFSTAMPYDLVIEKLQKGPDIVYYDVPIPEGFTARQVAARFAKRANLSEDKMLDLVLTSAEEFADEHPYLKDAYGGSMEGFLFPATYRVREGTTETAVVEMMLNKFDDEIAKLDMSYAESKNLTVADVVTIASILERETNLDKEYPLVASVIYNRLKIRMRLQLDSTVFYGMEPQDGIIHMSDLKDGKPHNTYGRAGLPAGPISNPGAKALEAAAHPAKTDYLYYVLTGKDGSQTFTNNYPDFLDAVKVYKRVFGK